MGDEWRIFIYLRGNIEKYLALSNKCEIDVIFSYEMHLFDFFMNKMTSSNNLDFQLQFLKEQEINIFHGIFTRRQSRQRSDKEI